MKKRFFVFLLTGLLVLVLSSCGISAPSKAELIGLLPDEIIRYTLDGETCTPRVTQLEIIRQQLSEKDCVTECKISLEDNNLSRQEYILLNCTYWDKGGWGLQSWEELQPPAYTLLAPFDENLFLEYFEQLGYHSANFEKCDTHDEVGHLLDGMDARFNGLLADNTPTEQCAAYQVYDGHENLLAFGTATVTGNFILTAEFPRSFHWFVETDTSGLSYSWDVSGFWRGDFTAYSKKYSIDTHLQMGVADYSYKGQIYYPITGECSVSGRDTSFYFDPNWTALLLYGDNYPNIYLSIDLIGYDKNSECRVRFYPDYAELSVYALNSAADWYTVDESCPFYRVQ